MLNLNALIYILYAHLIRTYFFAYVLANYPGSTVLGVTVKLAAEVLIHCAYLQITLGRATKDNPIDVDLSLEGPAWKISRRQGVIKLRNNGDFFVANEGRRPIYIDGKPVLNGNKQKLNNNSVVEVRS